MADFSSLKQTIQSYIKQNGNEEITGNILQDVLLAMVSTMGDSAINSLASALQDETTARQNADGNLQGNIAAEVTARQNADAALGERIDGLQTIVNAINTKLGEGYVYAGIATPSTNPGTPKGKVFYVALQDGTYTNFGGTVVTEGITILKYNGTSWVKEQALFTDGGVFDVSAYNNDTYDDLADALSGNNIPLNIRKGGMSVKFVQSSDNKYVQHRLMSDTFTTDITKWQNMGDFVEEKEHPIADNEVAGYLTDKNMSVIGKLMKNGAVEWLVENSKDIANNTRFESIEYLLSYVSSEVPDSGNGVIKYLTDRDGVVIATINNVGDTEFKGGGGFDGELTKSRIVGFDAVKILTDNKGSVIGWITNEGKVHIEELEVVRLIGEDKKDGDGGFNSYMYEQTNIADLTAIGNNLFSDVKRDENGWEVPTSIQMSNMVKKADQLKDIKWTPKLATIPITSNASATVEYYNTVEHTGIPYSVNGNMPVGLAVSLETFMTAINNKYSLMYSEDLLDSVSAWGIGVPHEPVNGHCRCYYGTHCNGFSSFVHGDKIAISCQSFKNTAPLYHIYSPIYPIVIEKNILRQGDVIDSPSQNHIRVIYNVKKDSNGNTTSIKVVESTGHANNGKVVLNEYSGYSLDSYITNIVRLGYELYRNIQLYRNTEYNISPFVLLDGETADAYVYNNDVCTFAGNKASFREGNTVVINYNLNEDANWGYTQLKLVKGGEVIYTQNISEIDETGFPTVTKNGVTITYNEHAWIVPNSLLTPGIYEVYAYNPTGELSSASTEFEVFSDNIHLIKVDDGVYELIVPEDYVLQGCFLYRNGSTASSNRFSIQASEKEIQNNTMKIYAKEILSSYNYFTAKIMVKGTYGSICTSYKTY